MLHFALCMSMYVCLEIKIFVFVNILFSGVDTTMGHKLTSRSDRAQFEAVVEAHRCGRPSA